MRREPAARPENQVALALAEIERIKALLVKVTDGNQLVIETGAGEGDTTAPVEAAAHTLYGVKHTRSFRATDGGGLNVDYEQGQIWIGGTFYSVVAGTTAMADDTTNYVFVNNAGAVADNATGFPGDCWPIAEVTTVAGDITALADRRSYSAQGVFGGGVVLGNPLLVGTDDVARGVITLYGDGMFTQDGGEAQFYLAAAHDGAFEYWIIQAWEDDLLIQRSDYGVVPFTIKADRTVEIAVGLLVDVITENALNAGVNLETSHFENGYAWIGNAGDPTNVTAGDLTASRLFITDAALDAEARLAQILDAYAPGAGVWNTLYVRANVDPGVGLVTDEVRAGKFEVNIRPTADHVGQAMGFYSEVDHDAGAFNVATMSGFFSQAVQDVAVTTVDNLFGARTQYRAINGNVGQAIGLLIERGSVGDGGVITTGTGLHIAASAAPAPANDIAIRSLGGHHRLVGDVRIGADAAPVSALEIVDAAFYLDIVAAKPRVNFDVDDYLEYDRAGGQYIFLIGGAPVVTFDAAAAALPPLVTIGVDDTTAGTLRVYGPSAGDEGGQLELYLSDAHDPVFQSWNFDVFEDDLRIWSSDGADIWYFRAGGAFEIPDSIQIAGDLNHDGAGVGFFGTAPAAQAAAYVPANVNPDRAYDADATTIDELADVLGTLIADLQSYGLLQ